MARDNGCDLAVQDNPIYDTIYIHHINPISKEDIINSSDKLFDPENLVCVSMDVHNALHYGDSSILEKNKVVERIPNTSLEEVRYKLWHYQTRLFQFIMAVLEAVIRRDTSM